MTTKQYSTFILLLISTIGLSQVKTKEIGIITDNDLYSSSRNDKYYTNGLELFYRFLSKNENENVAKKITEFGIGQYVYTPQFITVDYLSTIDRPYSGYIFAKASKNIFYKNESVFKTNFQLGFVGPNSFAEETQRGVHKLFHYNEVQGWSHQIHNTIAIQTHFLYSKKIFSKKETTYTDFHFQSEANIGTVFTGLSTGFLARLGFKKLVPMYNSNFHGASVSKESQHNTSEFYFYIAPSINYQLYDTTIQGSLFNNNSPVTFNLVPLRFNGEAGIKYKKNSLNLSYAFVYRGKELQNKINTGYFYGSIGISYLLK